MKCARWIMCLFRAERGVCVRDRSIGIGKIYAASSDRRCGSSYRREGICKWHRCLQSEGGCACYFPPPSGGTDLSVLQSDPGADSGGKYDASCIDGRTVSQSKRVEELLDILKLKDRRGYLPGQLSGGQQQRVSIGRALMNAPAVVLADEPTGNLDSGNSREIVELLKYSNRIYDQTMIMITHDEDIALQADRLIELADGRIIRDEVIRG